MDETRNLSELDLQTIPEKPGSPGWPTWIETKLYRSLDSLGIRYESQKPMGIYVLDAFLPSIGVAIEADGDAVHGCPHCGFSMTLYGRTAAQEAERCQVRDERLFREYGVAVIRIWGHSLQTDEDAVPAVEAALRPWTHLLGLRKR